MSADTSAMQAAAIRELCKPLRLPTVAAQAVRLAEQAAKERQSPLCFLEALLSAEVEEREQNAVARRIKDAHFPKVKALEDFDFQSAPHLPATLIRQLSEGGYIGRTEPVLFLGEAGTGKTHLAIGLAVAACRQRKRVRFTTAAEMVNELVEARHNNELSRVTARWTRYELLVIDEMGYVALAEAGAEMLFQVIAGRAEKAAVIVTTNLPFSEWTTVFPNARLCKAMLDRLTDQAHIIETGSDSYRFRRTLDRRRKKNREGDQEK
jgi:DNA replication protein DnaC